MFNLVLLILPILNVVSAMPKSETCDPIKLGSSNSVAMGAGNRSACFCASVDRQMCSAGTVEFYGPRGKYFSPKLGVWNIEARTDHFLIHDVPPEEGEWYAFSLKKGNAIVYVTCSSRNVRLMTWAEFPRGQFNMDDIRTLKDDYNIDVDVKKMRACQNALASSSN